MRASKRTFAPIRFAPLPAPRALTFWSCFFFFLFFFLLFCILSLACGFARAHLRLRSSFCPVPFSIATSAALKFRNFRNFAAIKIHFSLNYPNFVKFSKSFVIFRIFWKFSEFFVIFRIFVIFQIFWKFTELFVIFRMFCDFPKFL